MRDVTELKRYDEQLRILARFPSENPNPILRVGMDGTLIYANQAAESLCRAWECVSGCPLTGDWPEELRRCVQSNEVCRNVEVEAGGRTYSFMTVPIADTGSVYLYGHDVTDQKKYEEQLLLLASVFENSIEGILITDAEGTIERVNPGFTAITGYTAGEAVGNNPRLLKSDRHDEEFYRRMWEALLHDGFWTGEIWNRRKDGEAYPERLSITAIRNEEGRVSHYVAVFYDISEIKRGEEALEYQAYHDTLTGLPNRQLVMDRLEMSLSHAARNNEWLAVVFFDLDNFKRINDSLGHQAGDLFLQQVAARLTSCCREEDTVARLGGDEFLMILPEIHSENDAIEVVLRILGSLAEPMEIQGHDLVAGASIGITVFPADGEDAQTLIKNADLAMYRAKEAGRNTYRLYTEAMNEKAYRRLTLENDLRRAVSREEFLVHYHPKVNIATGSIDGVEALVRWQREDGALVSPAEFIPLAEETGLIIPLGEWVLQTACREIKGLHDRGYPISVAVNLSPRQFRQGDLMEMIGGALSESGLPAEHLEFEITETMVMDNVAKATEILGQLKKQGITFSIDDFGTGYSSLAFLKQLPLDALKIDRSFIKELPGNENDIAITSATISLAHALNLKVVAEGVETDEQLAFLRERDCDLSQGYRFCKPLPVDGLLEFLRRNSA